MCVSNVHTFSGNMLMLAILSSSVIEMISDCTKYGSRFGISLRAYSCG